MSGIGDWTKVDISYFLETGMKPDGDYAQGLMAEVIEHGYYYLKEEDLDALTEYLISLLPIDNYLSRINLAKYCKSPKSHWKLNYIQYYFKNF